MTLTGPGGVGKTRLALEAAGEAAQAFSDGVWFVGLGSVRDPELVAQAIARAFGIRESGGGSLLDRVAAFLGDQRLLLLLDNFEQVIDAAPLVARSPPAGVPA